MNEQDLHFQRAALTEVAKAMHRGLQESARVRHDGTSPELDMIALSEGLIDLSQARLDEVQQVVVADVAGGHEKQPGGAG